MAKDSLYKQKVPAVMLSVVSSVSSVYSAPDQMVDASDFISGT